MKHHEAWCMKHVLSIFDNSAVRQQLDFWLTFSCHHHHVGSVADQNKLEQLMSFDIGHK